MADDSTAETSPGAADASPSAPVAIELKEHGGRGGRWQVALEPGAMRLRSAEGMEHTITRAELPSRMTLVAGGRSLLLQLDQRRIFEVPAALRPVIERWLGPPTLAGLVHELERRVREFALPLGMLLLVSALVLSHDPTPTRLGAVFGVALIGLGLFATLRPHRGWFAVNACVFAVFALENGMGAVRGGGVASWLLCAFASHLAVQELKAFRRYRSLDRSVAPPPPALRQGHSRAGLASLFLAALVLTVLCPLLVVALGLGIAVEGARQFIAGFSGLLAGGALLASLLGMWLGTLGVVQSRRRRRLAALALGAHTLFLFVLERVVGIGR